MWQYACYMFDTDLLQTCRGTDMETVAQRLLDNLLSTHKRKIMTRIPFPTYTESGLTSDILILRTTPGPFLLTHLLFSKIFLNLMLLFSGKSTCWFYNENQPKFNSTKLFYQAKNFCGTHLKMKHTNKQKTKNTWKRYSTLNSSHFENGQWGADKRQKSSL